MKKVKKSKIGLIGLATMGANLARNFANNKIKTIVYNRTTHKTLNFIKIYGSDYLEGEITLKKFVNELEKPRKIIILVKAGDPVDGVINELTPLLSKNDIIIDGGNSNYKDTQRRIEELKSKGIQYMGCGVSGGEEGALNGPSLMPGGSKKAYKSIETSFKKIAAKDFAGKPTITYIGDNGAGHFVKTVHNGIEYGVMQIMAEAYDILRNVYNLNADQIADIFEQYNDGKLSSYLFEISLSVLRQPDTEAKGYLVDHILDKAAQKGTGRWTAISSFENSVPVPTVAEAVIARMISSHKEKREHFSSLFKKPKTQQHFSLKSVIKILDKALYAAMLITYAQGYDLISQTAKEEKWKINLKEISRIWEGGCIIRADILNFLHKNASSDKHLFEMPKITKELKKSVSDLREIVTSAQDNAIPVPALSASLSYFDSFTQKSLPANFIQGLRDYFGAHTYERIDKKGNFHTKWND